MLGTWRWSISKSNLRGCLKHPQFLDFWQLETHKIRLSANFRNCIIFWRMTTKSIMSYKRGCCKIVIDKLVRAYLLIIPCINWQNLLPRGSIDELMPRFMWCYPPRPPSERGTNVIQSNSLPKANHCQLIEQSQGSCQQYNAAVIFQICQTGGGNLQNYLLPAYWQAWSRGRFGRWTTFTLPVNIPPWQPN